MKKRRSAKTSLSLKNRLRLRQRLRFVKYAGIFSLFAFTITFLYNEFFVTVDSKANNRVNGMETLAEFKYRKLITFNSAQLPENQNLINFPVMISAQDPDFKSVAHGGKVLSENGFDIRFTKSDGITLLDFEIEKYDGKTGTIVAWIRMDTISKNKCSPLFMYFSNKYSLDESSNNAWNKTYRGVWHLKGLLNTKTPFSNQLAAEENKNVSDHFYNVSETNSSQFPCLNTSEDVNIKGEITLSAWINIKNSKQQIIITNQSSRKGGYRLALNKQGKLEFEISDKDGEVASIAGDANSLSLEKNKWYHVAAVYSDQKDSIYTYVNGKRDRMIKTLLSMDESPDDLQIGQDPAHQKFHFDGMIDEVHINAIAQNSDWVTTEYQNQSGPDKFISMGITEHIDQQISMSLLTFEAEPAGNNVELMWMTAEEINNETFAIERSLDGSSFEIIGSRQGAGNSNEILSYRYKDDHPVTGNSYYRIKMTDTDGNNEYSMIIPVKYVAENENEIQIVSSSSNTFKKDLTVDYLVPKTGKARVRLTNIKGDIIVDQEVYCEKSRSQRFQMNDERASLSGVFFLSISQSDQSKTIKLMKRL